MTSSPPDPREPQPLTAEPRRHLPARVATGGLVVVLVALSLFSVGAALFTTQAAHAAQRSVVLRDLYHAAEFALAAEEGLEHEYLLKRDDVTAGEHRRANAESARALQVLLAVEVEEHRTVVEGLVRSHDRYTRLVPAAFARRDLARAVAFDEEHLDPVLTQVRRVLEEEAVEHRREAAEALGNLLRVQRSALRATPVVFGLGLALLLVFASVLRRHRRELADQARQNQHQALHDALTGLPNRTLLRREGVEALRRAAGRDDRRVALMLIDLDRFKEINDTLGHHYGDVVLQAVARRLQQVVRPGDTVARLGGDEFAVLLPDAGDLTSALAAAKRVREALEVTIETEGVVLDVDASLGVVLSGAHGTDVDTLLRRADIAMYSAKERGLGVCPYDPEIDEHSPERLSLIGDLRRGIESGELLLHFQPKAALAGGEVCAVEALVRWQHPERGLVPPGLFVPAAEHTALIRPLTLWVLHAALAQCRSWRDTGRELQVAVNVSARNLLDDRFVDDVLEALSHWQVPASSLELEVTESAVMLDPDRARRILATLAGLGITLSLDDFGAGYTSLAHLRDLPVHQLKIDRTFVSTSMERHSDAVIVRSVVELGRALGLRTVAEGVEDAATLAALTGMGCDLAQGYHLSRPLPVEQLDAWLLARETAPVAA